MKKIICSIVFVLALFALACDDNEPRYAGTLLQWAMNPECAGQEAMCYNNVGYKCVLGKYRAVELCSLKGETCMVDAETCGGTVGEAVCCQ
jgi:hypothetical protein